MKNVWNHHLDSFWNWIQLNSRHFLQDSPILKPHDRQNVAQTIESPIRPMPNQTSINTMKSNIEIQRCAGKQQIDYRN